MEYGPYLDDTFTIVDASALLGSFEISNPLYDARDFFDIPAPLLEGLRASLDEGREAMRHPNMHTIGNVITEIRRGEEHLRQNLNYHSDRLRPGRRDWPRWKEEQFARGQKAVQETLFAYIQIGKQLERSRMRDAPEHLVSTVLGLAPVTEDRAAMYGTVRGKNYKRLDTDQRIYALAIQRGRETGKPVRILTRDADHFHIDRKVRESLSDVPDITISHMRFDANRGAA
jgi:hypothetical protein